MFGGAQRGRRRSWGGPIDESRVVGDRLGRGPVGDHAGVVDRLEEKRKVKAAAFHERKMASVKAQTAALKAATKAAPITEALLAKGY